MERGLLEWIRLRARLPPRHRKCSLEVRCSAWFPAHREAPSNVRVKRVCDARILDSVRDALSQKQTMRAKTPRKANEITHQIAKALRDKKVLCLVREEEDGRIFLS